MALSDPIADLLTRIRNSGLAEHRFCDVDYSKVKLKIVEILKEQGFIENFLVKVDEQNRGTIRVFLKYREGRKPVINGMRRVSKPGARRYIGHEEIPHFFGGLGCSVLSTSSGVMDGRTAKNKKVGGELLCLVW